LKSCCFEDFRPKSLCPRVRPRPSRPAKKLSLSRSSRSVCFAENCTAGLLTTTQAREWVLQRNLELSAPIIRFDASEHRSVGCLRFILMHSCTMSRVKSGCRPGDRLAVSELSSHRAVMHSQYQSTKCSIQSWNKGWTIEDEQCQKVGGGYKAVKLRFLLFL
jgi:hypothetical protein